MQLDKNPEFTRALHVMESAHQHIFITGRAGTGKSTLLNHFRDHTKKKVAVLAPTGVAAINVKGQTIHSFFKFNNTITVQSVKKLSREKQGQIYRNLDAIVIDEISMVRADLLDCIEKFMRLNGKNPEKPFGGVQMIFIGDLYQLPPVVPSKEKEIFSSYYKSPYFFSAHFFETFEMEVIELEKIYRQQDPEFINLLNAIRTKTVTDGDMAYLNQRLMPKFNPPEKDCFVYLTPLNQEAEKINTERLNQLTARAYQFSANIKGNFGREYYPTAETLTLKVGSQIMLVNNDPNQRWVNGSMGKITEIFEDKEEGFPIVMARLDNGTEVCIAPHKWEVSRFFLENSQIHAEVVGAFTQYPIVLAWAITIHKSQGKTFKNVIFDIGRGAFSAGQVYVALSRCTNYEGLILRKPIYKKDIWVNYDVVKFLTQFQYKKSGKDLTLEAKIHILEKAIREKGKLEMTYLKANDEKSKRAVSPSFVGEMVYKGQPYIGFRGYCHKSQEEKVFRVDRILEFELP